jgi:H+/gluconate symporter-like permease
MLGSIGVLAGVTLLIVFALRGTNIIVAALLSATLVAVTNGLSPLQAVTTDFVTAMTRFAGPFFLLFVTGAVFGRVMAESRAAQAIAMKLTDVLGPQRTLIIGTLVCALLTYGGVNVFIVIFTVYPLGLVLMKQANVPKRLFMAATALGAGTFTMTAMPGAPTFQNIIAARAAGTPLTAAPIAGLVASAVMLGLGLLYLEWQRKRAIATGEGFVPSPTDVMPELPAGDRLPYWGVAMLPMIVVLATIMSPMILSIVAPFDPESGALYDSIMKVAMASPLNWTVVAMAAGTLSGLLIFRKTISQPLVTMGHGAESAVLPLFNTAVVIGFGGVVSSTPAFESFSTAMLDTGLNPMISAVLSINIMAGIMGSATGALQIFATTLAPRYLELGLEPAVLHRLIAVGAGGLDSLPHSGAIITTLTIMGLSHRQAYKDTAVVTVLIPIVAVVVLIVGYLMIGHYMVGS